MDELQLRTSLKQVSQFLKFPSFIPLKTKNPSLCSGFFNALWH